MAIYTKYPQEPAHPELIRRRDDLVSIYQRIRKEKQAVIDATFDKVSRRIGFIVTSTLPAVLEIGKKAEQSRFELQGEQFKETIWQESFAEVLRPAATWEGIAAGSYRLYLLWAQALAIRFQTEWMEPAHPGVIYEIQVDRRTIPFDPHIPEPAHWFDPNLLLEAEERLLIGAIDVVYPELKLVERLGNIRDTLRKVGPGVREPAHFNLG